MMTGILLKALRRPWRTVIWLALSALVGLGLSGAGWYGWARYWAPRSHLQAAQRAMDRRDFQEARQHLARCLEAWPDDAATHLLAARAARQARAFTEAEEQLALCQHLLEKHADPGVGDTALEWALLEAQRGRLAQVEPYLRARLSEDHPDSLLILDVLTWELMGAYRLAEAGEYLDQWLQRRPDDYEALVRRGWVGERQFDFPVAARDYGKALEIDADQDNVRLRLAELLLLKNQAPQALPHVERLRERQPGNPAVAIALARCRRLEGQFPEARRILDEVLVAHPQNAVALSECGLVALESNQPAEAERLLRRAAGLEPTNRQINYSLSQCLSRLGKKDEADRITAQLAQADNDLKRMSALMGDVQRRPHDAAVRYEVGMIFMRNGFTDDGLHWLATALEADPGHRPTHEAVLKYYERIGDTARAARHRHILQLIEEKAAAPK